MSNLKFAKLFEMGPRQVVVLKEFDHSEEVHRINQITHCKDHIPSMSLGFDSEAERNDAFEKYNHEDAKAFLKTIDDLL